MSTNLGTQPSYDDAQDVVAVQADGVIDAQEAALRNMANAMYSWINEQGDI